MYKASDLIPDLKLIKSQWDDEFNQYLYFVEDNPNYKYMKDLTQKQQDFINKRFKQRELMASPEFKKRVKEAKLKMELATLEEELKIRNVTFNCVTIKGKVVTVAGLKQLKYAGTIYKKCKEETETEVADIIKDIGRLHNKKKYEVNFI